MRLLKTALFTMAMMATTCLMAQNENYERISKQGIGDWIIVEEYEITSTDNGQVERQTKVNIGDHIEINTPRKSLQAHYPLYYMGFNRMSNNPYSIEYASGIAQRQSKCWDWGVYLFDNSISFNKRGTIGLSYAFGFGRSSYKFSDGNFFYNDNGITRYGTKGDKSYDETWFRYWGFRMPINLELQHYVNNKPFFLTFGPEIEYRFAAKSLGRIDGGKKRDITKNFELNPLNVNLMAQIGYDGIGFIAKLSLIDLFQNPMRPEPLVGGECIPVGPNCEVYPLTIGFSILY